MYLTQVQTAGITSEKSQLLCNALQTPVMMISTLSGLFFIDRFGRRKLLMLSSLGMTVSVAVIIACTATQSGHPAVGLTGIAFIYVFLVAFAFVWTPCESELLFIVYREPLTGKGYVFA